MSMAKIVKIPTDKSPVLQLYLSYSQDIARASALRATIPRTETWSLCTFYRTLFRKDIIPHAKWPFSFIIGQLNPTTQRNPLPDHLKCAYMVYSNERMKNKSIFDRLIFLTFLITNPKVSCRIQPMLANKIEERANGYLIRAVPFRKAAK